MAKFNAYVLVTFLVKKVKKCFFEKTIDDKICFTIHSEYKNITKMAQRNGLMQIQYCQVKHSLVVDKQLQSSYTTYDFDPVNACGHMTTAPLVKCLLSCTEMPSLCFSK